MEKNNYKKALTFNRYRSIINLVACIVGQAIRSCFTNRTQLIRKWLFPGWQSSF